MFQRRTARSDRQSALRRTLAGDMKRGEGAREKEKHAVESKGVAAAIK